MTVLRDAEVYLKYICDFERSCRFWRIDFGGLVKNTVLLLF